MSEMIERVARAIRHAEVKFITARDDMRYEEIARAAIEAMREPNGEMCEAGAAYYHDNYQPGRAKEQTTAPLIWRAMIDATLKTESDVSQT